jgi:hypothetical protein
MHVRLVHLSPTYWLDSVIPLIDGGQSFARDERAVLDEELANGLPRYSLRGHLGTVPWLYFLAGVPLALAFWAITASSLADGPVDLIVRTLLVYSQVAAVFYLIRWLVTPDDDVMTRWNPLLADVALAIVAIGIVVFV